MARQHGWDDRAFYGLGALLAFAAYAVVFWLVGSDPVEAGLASLRNLIPLAVLSVGVRSVLVRFVMRLGRWAELGAHIGLAIVFAFLWYWLLMVSIGLSTGDGPTRFRVEPFFPDAAFIWQMLQGIAVYGMVAALTYLRARPELPSFVVDEKGAATESGEPGFTRYFIRQGEDIHPVDVSQIVSITGADDYAEVTTLSGRHLVRMTLADFEKSLESGRFIRVHRSRIVNVERILRAEPAGGGRMLLHMENGEIVQASRTGSRLLRDRVI